MESDEGMIKLDEASEEEEDHYDNKFDHSKN